MTQTLPDIKIDSTWQSLNTLSGVAIGSPISLNNKSMATIIIAEGTQPNINSLDGVLLTNPYLASSDKLVSSGSLEIWGRVQGVGEGTISLQRV